MIYIYIYNVYWCELHQLFVDHFPRGNPMGFVKRGRGCDWRHQGATFYRWTIWDPKHQLEYIDIIHRIPMNFWCIPYIYIYMIIWDIYIYNIEYHRIYWIYTCNHMYSLYSVYWFFRWLLSITSGSLILKTHAPQKRHDVVWVKSQTNSDETCSLIPSRIPHKFDLIGKATVSMIQPSLQVLSQHVFSRTC